MDMEQKERLRRQIVALCYAGLDSAALRQRLNQELRRLVPFSAASWMTIDPVTLLITSSVRDGLAASGFRTVAENEYLDQDYNRLADLATGPVRVRTLLQETSGLLERSKRFRDLLWRRGICHELRAAFVVEGACWGGLFLYRRQGEPGFSPFETGLIQGITEHIAFGLRYAARAAQPVQAEPEPPGLLILDEAGVVQSATPEGERWLQELTRSPVGLFSPALDSIGLLGRSRATRLRVLAPSGRWTAISGAPLRGAREGGVAVTMEPADPGEVAPLRLQALGLTQREREVAQCVMDGLPTREIAGRLYLSEYTVQDHLKSIFHKTGASNRRQLVSMLLRPS